MGSALKFLVDTLIDMIVFVVIANAIISWLVAFGVLNVNNPTIYRILQFLDRVTDPLLRPIRRFMPNLGGIDVSPIILILLLQALRILLDNTLFPPLIASAG